MSENQDLQAILLRLAALEQADSTHREAIQALRAEVGTLHIELRALREANAALTSATGASMQSIAQTQKTVQAHAADIGALRVDHAHFQHTLQCVRDTTTAQGTEVRQLAGEVSSIQPRTANVEVSLQQLNGTVQASTEQIARLEEYRVNQLAIKGTFERIAVASPWTATGTSNNFRLRSGDTLVRVTCHVGSPFYGTVVLEQLTADNVYEIRPECQPVRSNGDPGHPGPDHCFGAYYSGQAGSGPTTLSPMYAFRLQEDITVRLRIIARDGDVRTFSGIEVMVFRL